MKAGRWVILAWAAAVLAAGAQEAGQTVAGFRVPEYDADNNLKSQLFGDFARVLPDGVIEITGLKIDFYAKQQEVQMTVTSPKCRYDQKANVAESEAEIRISRENMVVTGVGFSWNGRNERFHIRDQAKVVLKGLRSGIETGAKP